MLRLAVAGRKLSLAARQADRVYIEAARLLKGGVVSALEEIEEGSPGAVSPRLKALLAAREWVREHLATVARHPEAVFDRYADAMLEAEKGDTRWEPITSEAMAQAMEEAEEAFNPTEEIE